jgi:hypothetical protein
MVALFVRMYQSSRRLLADGRGRQAFSRPIGHRIQARPKKWPEQNNSS